ncbi:amino acid/polyamine transporter I [Cercophora newfieldiana]|uniref:Amino acid/polyamine transporter I n=1 Tax=Cercophora newfieldiana TaxID=92897 RepID=A0AA39XSS3_9PEZI|nr:amino acid/polyamine transporter I [Cercophora newfieldiana]
MTSSATTPLLDERAREPVPADNRRKPAALSFWDGVALVLGIQIGSGIFVSPALVARNTGSEAPALLVWVVAGLLAWACAACYVEMGTRLPVNGGPQEYLAYCFGDLFGFLTSWGCIFGVKPCSSAILALFIADYVCEAANIAHYNRLVALAVVALVTAVNCAGNRLSNVSTKVLLGCKTIGVGFVIVMGFAVLLFPQLSPSPEPSLPPEPPAHKSGNYVDALVAAMWAYSGWEVLGLVGGDIRNPTRNFPRIINTSMTIVLALTLFANVAYFAALSFDDIARSTTIGLHFLGRAGSIVYAVAICLSTLGTLNVKVFTAGRLTQAAADRGYLPMMMKTIAGTCSKKNRDDNEEDDNLTSLGTAQPIFESIHSPVRLGDGSIPISGIVFNSLVISAFVLAGDVGSLVSLMGIIEYAVVFLTLVGLLYLRLGPVPDAVTPDHNQTILKVPFLLIPVALITVASMVVISTIWHPRAGIGFILCCVVSGLIHTFAIRPRRTSA